jgi:catechol 2,3-dioxygenase-like lactoylglutathione lyase family enzyme
VTAVDHVGLSVADLDAAVAFWDEAFGFVSEFPFALGRDEIRGAMLRHPESGARVELFVRPGAADGAVQGHDPIATLAVRGYGHVALATPDLDALFARSTAAGAKTVFAPGPSPEPGVRFAFVADPEGNLIEFVERVA